MDHKYIFCPFPYEEKNVSQRYFRSTASKFHTVFPSILSSYTVFPVISAPGAFEIEMQHCHF